jgi:flagellar basal-body rod protein FlgB
MDIASVPLFSMLKSRIGYLNQRQELIAQNVANASTPGFTPHDLKPFTLDQHAGATLALTSAGGGAGAQTPGMIPLSDPGGGQSGFKAVDAPDDETKLDGNQVVLEEQMMKMSETRTQYEAAVGVYVKAMNFIQMAAKEPGK